MSPVSNPELEQFETRELLDEVELRLRRLKRSCPTNWWHEAVEVVTAEYGITDELLFSDTRKRAVTEPRGVAMWLLRKDRKRTFEEIGNIFKKGHDTVMHWCNRIEDEIFVSKSFAQKMERIEVAYLRRVSPPRPAALLERVKAERGLLAPKGEKLERSAK